MKQLQVTSYKTEAILVNRLKNLIKIPLLQLVTCILFLSSCGFTPMYSAKDMNIASELSNVEISNIPDYEGQYLRNALIDRFYTNARPNSSKYILKIEPIKESTTNLDITKNANATRVQLKLSTKINLIDQQSGEIVLSRNLNSISSYNILTSEFATRVSAKNMRENTLNDLARKIELHIGLYLQQ